jgi:hypothetical protein
MMQVVVQGADLFRSIGGARLLAVAEGGVRYEHGIRRPGHDKDVVELASTDFFERIERPEKLWFFRIPEFLFRFRLLELEGVFGHTGSLCGVNPGNGVRLWFDTRVSDSLDISYFSGKELLIILLNRKPTHQST